MKNLVYNDPDAAKNNRMFMEGCHNHIPMEHGVVHTEVPVNLATNGAKIFGAGCPLLHLDEGTHFSDNNPNFSIGTLVVPSNPTPNLDVFMFRACGQQAFDFSVVGRRWERFHDVPDGPRCRSCIAVDGVSQPPSGRTVLRHLQLSDAEIGVNTLGSDPNHHADNCYLDTVFTDKCPTNFRTGYRQSVSHVVVNGFQEYKDKGMVGVDIAEGGKITVLGFRQNGPYATPIRVGSDMYPNCNSIRMYGYDLDHVDVVGAYFCPLDSPFTTMTGCLEGIANNPQFAFEKRLAGVYTNRRFQCRVVCGQETLGV